jgi:transcriptional regulator with XRE-family HTH domain
MTAPEKRLAEVLQMLREREELSREQLGWRIGLHRNVVARLERDPGMIRLTIFRRWCRALNEPMGKVIRFCEKAPQEVQKEK